MARRTNGDIGKIVRIALRGLRIKPRRQDGPTLGECYGRKHTGARYMESDRDFLENNREAAVALLEALSP